MRSARRPGISSSTTSSSTMDKHADWWLRESAFMALSGLAKDDALYLKILPTLLTLATANTTPSPRAI